MGEGKLQDAPAIGPEIRHNPITQRLLTAAKKGLLPTLLYFAVFVAYTHPALLRFHTHFFADQGDGLQGVWNLWWAKFAVTEVHQSPWHTNYLHWPYGTSLLGHNLNLFNGFLAIVTLPFLTLIEAHNVIVIFSFVTGGLNAFLLADHLTESFPGSLVAGFVFTFSTFHFAHAEGHLMLVSLEWLPLFILLWLSLLKRPTVSRAVAGALVLLCVLLCDYYYFLYCVLTALVIFFWPTSLGEGVLRFKQREYVAALGVFLAVVLATSGLLVGRLLWLNAKDPLVGAHPAEEYSLDLLAPFIYGGHWRFASLTEPYWLKLPGNIHESSVHLGFAVIVLLIYAWRKKRETGIAEIGLLFSLMFFFALLALGPRLHICGRPLGPPILPYSWLQKLLPPLRLSGVPVRMMAMVVLSAGVISAAAFKLLLRGSRRGQLFAAALVAILLVEYLPKPIPLSEVVVPGYVRVLKALPGDGGLVDTVSYMTHALYYQTIHRKPQAFGFLSRLPRSVVERDARLTRTLEQENFAVLWREYRIRYLLIERPWPSLAAAPGVKMIWSDGHQWLFDLSGLSFARNEPGFAKVH